MLFDFSEIKIFILIYKSQNQSKIFLFIHLFESYLIIYKLKISSFFQHQNTTPYRLLHKQILEFL